ncbi:DUF485 domain-containing protein [Bacillus mesophilum]|uniref:DUF485 domain-containing protein n=1 Tax=Bacillus mesophilum TaxID=1071718 RepID=A0A7V7RMD9_9BACI|nr:DUF485 domain-containing protein [Bacillus mesophilum]KAB2333439.1 DUF485 domain-containing protein [Bacillus mesophilum]
MENTAKELQNNEEQINYDQIANSSEFKQLIKQKKKFLVPMTIFFLVFYFTLPILTSYTTILNQPAIGSITWTWVYAFAQFIMTWALCMIYVRKAAGFDQKADEIVDQYTGKGDQTI